MIRPLPMPVADILGTHAVVSHVLAALLRRAKLLEKNPNERDVGTFIDISMTDVAAAALVVSEPARVALDGVVDLTRGGSPLCGGAPCYDLYPTKDMRHVVIAALERPYWLKVLELLELPTSLYGTASAQFAVADAGDAVRNAVAAATSRRTWAEWREILTLKDVMMDVVLLPGEAATSPHFIQRSNEATNTGMLPSALWRFDSRLVQAASDRAPPLGSTGLLDGFSKTRSHL